jgi:hypothetical protein
MNFYGDFKAEKIRKSKEESEKRQMVDFETQNTSESDDRDFGGFKAEKRRREIENSFERNKEEFGGFEAEKIRREKKEEIQRQRLEDEAEKRRREEDFGGFKAERILKKKEEIRKQRIIDFGPQNSPDSDEEEYAEIIRQEKDENNRRLKEDFRAKRLREKLLTANTQERKGFENENSYERGRENYVERLQNQNEESNRRQMQSYEANRFHEKMEESKRQRIKDFGTLESEDSEKSHRREKLYEKNMNISRQIKNF